VPDDDDYDYDSFEHLQLIAEQEAARLQREREAIEQERREFHRGLRPDVSANSTGSPFASNDSDPPREPGSRERINAWIERERTRIDAETLLQRAQQRGTSSDAIREEAVQEWIQGFAPDLPHLSLGDRIRTQFHRWQSASPQIASTNNDNDPHSLGGGSFEAHEAYQARLAGNGNRAEQYPFDAGELQPGYEFDPEEGVLNHLPADREFQ
jgi:hypothetical protein